MDPNYDENYADASKVAREKFLVATLLLVAYIHQYGGMITQLRNYYAKGQYTYPATVQKAQALLKAWEGEKSLVNGPNKGLSCANVANDDDGDGGASSEGDAQTSGGCASCGGATETRRCYYCKK